VIGSGEIPAATLPSTSPGHGRSLRQKFMLTSFPRLPVRHWPGRAYRAPMHAGSISNGDREERHDRSRRRVVEYSFMTTNSAAYMRAWFRAKGPEYRVWAAMKARCSNSRHANFSDYGGRGITVCRRWCSFENFLADMGRRPSSRYTLERRRNNRGYSQTNCKWALPKEQHRNTRTNRRLKNKVQAAWTEGLGLSHSAIYMRLLRGWSVADAVSLTKYARA
jgi:hypothetical protein